MADPLDVVCTANTWVLAATNVSTGVIWRKLSRPKKYLYTYRGTGGTAPTLETEGVPIFKGRDKDREPIEGSGIDIYLYAKGAAGLVRVDV